MDEATIIEVLKSWNPWEKEIDAGIKRQRYIKKLYSYLERKEVIALKGVRRAGKSTIIKQLILEMINNKIDKKQIRYLNLEDYNFANNLKIELFEEVLSAYKKYLIFISFDLHFILASSCTLNPVSILHLFL